MLVDGNTLSFHYVADGKPMSFVYNGTTYYYATNLQGDIVAILSKEGTQVVAYSYDAWGNILSITGTKADTIGKYNPLRYRGYVYDTESKLYYLQSRYYDPYVGRFINADTFATTGQGLLGNNMFAYCNNNPAKNYDPQGCLFAEHAGLGGGPANYVIYYLHPESDKNLGEPAKKNHSLLNSKFIEVGSFAEFTDAMNHIPWYTDNVYIYLHGDVKSLSFYYAQYYSASDIKDNLRTIAIYGDIYLFACKGGRGDLASAMANATNSTVIASAYKVSFSNGAARCGWRDYLKDSIKHGIFAWYSFSPAGTKQPYSPWFIYTQ